MMEIVDIPSLAIVLKMDEGELKRKIAQCSPTPDQSFTLGEAAKPLARGAMEELITALVSSPKCRARTARQFVNERTIEVFVRFIIDRD